MAKKLGIRLGGNPDVFFGRILKDGMTISNKAEDITENNFIQVMLSWLEMKTDNYKNPLVINSKSGTEWIINVKKNEKQEEKCSE